ncbi:MAG TPA: glycosyltransferase [Desulfuromonadaceae bacterium]|jgi:glycosyltransferase involved in cell wall biosynthesis
MNKILYISTSLSSNASGGRTLSEANLEILKACCNTDIRVLSVGRVNTKYINITSTSNTFQTALANLRLYSGCLHKNAFDAIINEIAGEKPSILYFDTSLFGRLALAVNKLFPEIKIITLFQNIEFDFKLQCYSGIKRILYTPAIFSDWMNERWAIRYSETIVALHKNDSIRLQQIYGRKADFIHPICIASNIVETAISSINPHKLPDEYILFVGSAFPPNLEAIKFLCDKVMPYLDIHLIVVGSNLENYRQMFSANNVSVIGSVSDLTPFYDNAKLVVTPIFTGAGMKVKIAEALMHGKCVIGSKFSLIGYEKAVDRGVCIVANSANDYVEFIKNYKTSSAVKLLAKELFLQEFSLSAGITRMKYILGMVT